MDGFDLVSLNRDYNIVRFALINILKQALAFLTLLELEVVRVNERHQCQLFTIVAIRLDIPEGARDEHKQANQLLPVELLLALTLVQHEENPHRRRHKHHHRLSLHGTLLFDNSHTKEGMKAVAEHHEHEKPEKRLV